MHSFFKSNFLLFDSSIVFQIVDLTLDPSRMAVQMYTPIRLDWEDMFGILHCSAE